VQLADAQAALWELRFALPQFMVVPERRQEILASRARWLSVIDQSIATYARAALTADERAALEAWQRAFRRYANARPRFFALYGEGNIAAAVEWRRRKW